MSKALETNLLKIDNIIRRKENIKGQILRCKKELNFATTTGNNQEKRRWSKELSLLIDRLTDLNEELDEIGRKAHRGPKKKLKIQQHEK